MIPSPLFPKRVLMTADTIGGVWTYALELARAFGTQGIEVALATMGAPLGRNQRAEVGSIPTVEVFESSYKLEWMNEPWDDIDAAGEWLLELEDRVRPDIVHLNSFPHGALPWHVPKIVVGHSCVLSWWQATKGSDAPAEWDFYRRSVREGLALSDVVVAPSAAMLVALNEHYGPIASSAVIPNGRRLEGNRPRAKHDFILAAGRLWDEAKNISALAEIAPQLSWPVYLAGEDRHPDGQQARHKHIHHLGHLPQSELQVWLQRAAIYAAPARYEPFGLSVLEAALAGCALVLGDIPSLRENWNDAAVFVNPDDASAIGDAVQKLIAEPDLRSELSARARRAAAQFTPEKMASDYLAAYARAAQASRLQRERPTWTTGSLHTVRRDKASTFSKGVQCAS